MPTKFCCVVPCAIILCVIVASLSMNDQARAQTVQLPTFNSTGVSTTVMVPDRGQTFLGGINSARSSSNEFGTPLLPFRNRSIGSERSAVNFWTRVWIHDFEAMDEMLLGQAARARGGASTFANAPREANKAAFVAAQPVREKSELVQLLTRDGGGPVENLTAVDLQLAKARELAAAGKLNVAKIYYQMAIRRSESAQREAITAELATLTQATIIANGRKEN